MGSVLAIPSKQQDMLDAPVVWVDEHSHIMIS